MTNDLQNLLAGMVRPLEFSEWDGGMKIAKTSFGKYILDSDFRLSFPTGSQRRYELEITATTAAQADYTARAAEILNPDAVMALVAAAYADAAGCVFEAQVGDADNDLPSIFNRIRSRTRTDATAALARMMADARAEGLEMAAKWIESQELTAEEIEDGVRWKADCTGVFSTAIRAMKGEKG